LEVSLRSDLAFGDAMQWFGLGHAVRAAASRNLETHLALVASAGYSHYSAPIFLLHFPEGWVRPVRDARLMPLAVGLRYSTRLQGPKRPQAALEFAPTLYWYRYRATLESGSVFTAGAGRSSDSFDALVPGFQLCGLMRAPLSSHLGIDLGASYYFSGTLMPHRLLLANEPALFGSLNTLAATFGLWVRP
jgi:hypothetical protein